MEEQNKTNMQQNRDLPQDTDPIQVPKNGTINHVLQSENSEQQPQATPEASTEPQPQIVINNQQPVQPTQSPRIQNPTVLYPKNPFPWHKIIYAIESSISILLVFRVFFSMFAADQTNQIVSTIFLITDPLIKPFENIFDPTPTGGVTVEWSIFLAMIAYAIIATILGKLIQMFLYRNR